MVQLCVVDVMLRDGGAALRWGRAGAEGKEKNDERYLGKCDAHTERRDWGK